MKYSFQFLKTTIVFLLLFFVRFSYCQGHDTVTHTKMRWSPTALSFTNYAVVDNNDSLPYNPYLANTNLNITYYYKLSHKDSLIIFIENLFVPKGSWVKTEHTNDSVLLKHEQGHFNLSEIYARKLATAFSSFHFTNNYKQEIKQVATRVLNEQNKHQKQYDEETNYGENHIIQKIWNEKFENNLHALKPINGRIIIAVLSNK